MSLVLPNLPKYLVAPDVSDIPDEYCCYCPEVIHTGNECSYCHGVSDDPQSQEYQERIYNWACIEHDRIKFLYSDKAEEAVVFELIKDALTFPEQIPLLKLHAELLPPVVNMWLSGNGYAGITLVAFIALIADSSP